MPGCTDAEIVFLIHLILYLSLAYRASLNASAIVISSCLLCPIRDGRLFPRTIPRVTISQSLLAAIIATSDGRITRGEQPFSRVK